MSVISGAIKSQILLLANICQLFVLGSAINIAISKAAISDEEENIEEILEALSQQCVDGIDQIPEAYLTEMPIGGRLKQGGNKYRVDLGITWVTVSTTSVSFSANVLGTNAPHQPDWDEDIVEFYGSVSPLVALYGEQSPNRFSWFSVRLDAQPVAASKALLVYGGDLKQLTEEEVVVSISPLVLGESAYERLKPRGEGGITYNCINLPEMFVTAYSRDSNTYFEGYVNFELDRPCIVLNDSGGGTDCQQEGAK